jgi:hypothetical protein
MLSRKVLLVFPQRGFSGFSWPLAELTKRRDAFLVFRLFPASGLAVSGFCAPFVPLDASRQWDLHAVVCSARECEGVEGGRVRGRVDSARCRAQTLPWQRE